MGLRDVMDEPKLLVPEWQRKKVLPALRDLYDEIWIYGLPQICEPLAGITLPASVRKKITYTGYLAREVSTAGAPPRMPDITKKPYILVTTGGGGDGEELIDWVLRAYEHDPLLPYPALMVLGPFMQPERQTEFMNRAAKLKRVDAITFHSNLEALVAGASATTAIGHTVSACGVPRHAHHQTTIVAPVGRPPVLGVGHQRMQVFDHCVQIQRQELRGVVEVVAHGVGRRCMLVQNAQLQLIGPPVGVGRCSGGGVLVGCVGERALGWGGHDELL